MVASSIVQGVVRGIVQGLLERLVQGIVQRLVEGIVHGSSQSIAAIAQGLGQCLVGGARLELAQMYPLLPRSLANAP